MAFGRSSALTLPSAMLEGLRARAKGLGRAVRAWERGAGHLPGSTASSSASRSGPTSKLGRLRSRESIDPGEVD